MARRPTKSLAYLFIFLSIFLIFFLRLEPSSHVKFFIIKTVTLPVRLATLSFYELKKLFFYHRTYDEYLRLQNEVDTLKARLTGLDEVLLENTRLDNLLNFRRNLLFSSVAANVVGRDPSNWNAAVMLNKGKQDGIDVGMPVVSAQGVVGKVDEASEHMAKVVLLSDPSFSVVALVKRSRETGLVSGTLQGKARMRYLSSGADVQPGDVIITSKLSSSFPEGLIVGTVIHVSSRANDLSVDCVVEPAVSFSQIEEVLVVQKQ